MSTMSSVVETLDSITFYNIDHCSTISSCSQYSVVSDVASNYIFSVGVNLAFDLDNYSEKLSAVFATFRFDIAIYPAISFSIFYRISGFPSPLESSFIEFLCFLKTYNIVSIRSYKLKRALSFDNYII